MKTKRKVQVLDKMTDAAREKYANRKECSWEGARSLLAVGTKFKFQSGANYVVMPTGAVRRLNGKPWNSKSERKRYLQERRDRA